MKVSKKHKRQIKEVLKGSSLKSEIRKPKKTWAVKKGDLVSINDDSHGIVVEANGNGHFLILTSSGTRWYHAKKVLKV